MTHLLERLQERMTEISEIRTLLEKVCRFAKDCSQAVAVHAYTLTKHYGDTRQTSVYNRASNGNEVWFIVRNSEVKTVMFRRSEQPKTCDRFNVQKVVDLRGERPIVLNAA